jgi:uncharacterized protein DUF3987
VPNENLIRQFIEYTQAYESPTDFFYWSMVVGIAAALRDNCYILLGDTRVYPNLYILIIAKPAMRKAKPLNSVVELLKYVDNTKIIEGRTSIQAVIQRLGEIERRQSGATIKGASGIVFSEEISAMFTEDDANIPVLTDLYDYKSTYTSALVSRGTTRLSNVVVSLLGASNEELLKPVFNNRAIYGGLLSRCLIVYGDKVRHRNSLMYEDAKKYDPSELRRCFKIISGLHGTFSITKEGRDYYNEWYISTCPELEKNAGNTGAEGRIHTNVLKLAMVLTVAEKYNLEIGREQIERAIHRVQTLFTNYKRLTLGSGKSQQAEPSVILLKVLWEAKDYELKRQEIMYKTWADMSMDDLDAVTKTLLGAGLIQTREDKKHGTIYTLTGLAVEYFRTNKA